MQNSNWWLLVVLCGAFLAFVGYLLRETIPALALGVWYKISGKTQSIQVSAETRNQLKRKVALITGANRGLGRAIAARLVALGVHVIIACRSGIPEAGQDVLEEARKLNQGQGEVQESQIEMVQLDLADLDSIEKCVKELKRRNVSIDFYIPNAAVVMTQTVLTKAGLESQFAVNYFGHFALTQRLLDERLIKLAEPDTADDDIPRIVVITSEAHRSSVPLAKQKFGEPMQYSMGGALSAYSYSKLLVVTFAYELARRINQRSCRAFVSTMCPGPVDTNIAGNAPKLIQQLIVKPLFFLFFTSPLQASLPVISMLLQSRTKDDATVRYQHMATSKTPRADAMDPAAGSALWQDSMELYQRIYLPLLQPH